MLAYKRQFEIAFVLHAIANNRRFRMVGQRQRDHEFSFTAHFQTNAIPITEAQDVLHDLFLLIDLERVSRDIFSLVCKLLDGGVEGSSQLLQLIVDNLRETQDDGG